MNFEDNQAFGVTADVHSGNKLVSFCALPYAHLKYGIMQSLQKASGSCTSHL